MKRLILIAAVLCLCFSMTALAQQIEGPAVGHDRALPMPIPEWAPPEAAQVILLSRYDPALTGRVEYPPAFDEEL